MLACSFLIKSSGKLLVTRTGLKARLSSILGQIRQLILELLALEWRKFHTFELEYLWSQLANLDQILCVASLGWGKGCIRFWGRLTLAHWTQVSDRCPLGYLLFRCSIQKVTPFQQQMLVADFGCQRQQQICRYAVGGITVLTHICLVDPSILINWTSPFSILGVSDVLFHFHSISNRYSWKLWSGAVFWSGSALFAWVPKMGR